MIRVLFFAGLRDAAQAEQVDVNADGINTVRELVAAMGETMPAELLQALSDETAMVSVDHKYAGWDADVHDGAEVGFLPPVSGG